MWEWVRLYWGWINRQPRELRLLLKSGVWIIAALGFALLGVPVLAAVFTLVMGGGFLGRWVRGSLPSA